METLDYKKLGFKCGIEIHQQLEGLKLFCNCPTIIRRDKPDFTIRRELRATAGETGDIDQAAAHEQKKQKFFLYQGYEDTTCLVEADEEPPHPINQDALSTTLQVAKLLNAKVVDQIQVMRKTVIDGSNTTGFQRTALVGIDGYVEINGKKIGIPVICLEEEACQIVKRTADCDVYNLSRLGIPLIEIATDPTISDPVECRDVAARIGMILRSTGKCKRGIGSIRQDVNLSIKGGARVEVKGFQELKSIPKVIDNEVKRQLDLIKKDKKPELEVRKAEPDFSTSFLRPMPGADRMYPETDIPTIVSDLSAIEDVELIDDKLKKMSERYKIPGEIAKQILKKEIDFAALTSKFRNVPSLVTANILIVTPKEIKKRFNLDVSKLRQEDFEEVLGYLDSGKINKEAVVDILVNKIKGKKVDLSKYAGVSDTQLEKEIKKIIAEKKDLSMGAYMGLIMSKHRGKVDGKKVSQILKSLL